MFLKFYVYILLIVQSVAYVPHQKKKKGEEERQHLPPHPTPPSKKPINFPHYNDPYFNLQTVAYVAAAV